MIYQNIWFLLWAVLWTVYFMLDGYDIGAGIVSPFVARTDEERLTVIRSIGPFWDGNEVWFITAGGATFAAFPRAYAGMFSYLYTPLLLLLLILILRGVSIEFGYTEVGPKWRNLWQKVFFLSSILLAIVFGLFFGNLFYGMPVDQKGLQGGLLGLITPAGIIASLLFVSTFGLHGALWLYLKSDEPVKVRAKTVAEKLVWTTLVLSLVFLVYLFLKPSFRVNYLSVPVLFILPFCALVPLFNVRLLLKKDSPSAFRASMLFVFFLFATGFAGMYPALLPSSVSPEFSFTIYNSSSSPYTLRIMTVVAVVFVPLVVFYQAWVYRVFKK